MLLTPDLSKRFDDRMSSAAPRRTTITDVAKRAGVSVSTVSYRLSGDRPVSEETGRRIDEAMRELNFAPNSRARNLRRRRSDSIGIVLPDPENPFFMQVASGLESVLRPEGVCLVLCPTGFEDEREKYYARLLTTRQLDGVVLLSGTGRLVRALEGLAARRQVVLVDEPIKGLKVPLVTADNVGAARSLAAHAVSLGHRRIGIIAGPPKLWTARERLAGMTSALAASGVGDPGWVAHAPYTTQGGADVARAMLSKKRRPSLIMAANDFQALGVYAVCRELGLTVGEDVSVTGFDDIPTSDLVTPGLATVLQPAFEMGAVAGRVLLDRLANESGTTNSERHTLATSLVLRDSLAPVGRASDRKVGRP
jgi:DNA-binding LacI/PurR family transcriptional regulator